MEKALYNRANATPLSTQLQAKVPTAIAIVFPELSGTSCVPEFGVPRNCVRFSMIVDPSLYRAYIRAMPLDLPPNLKAPWVPDIGVRLVSDPEKTDAEAFYHNFYELQKWSDDFASSVALYDFARTQPHGDFGPTVLMRRWMMIGARNGGLALRNFCQCLAAARGVVGKVASWKGKINLTELKAIETEFRDRFPDIDKLRHAVAHPEFYANPSVNMTGATADMPGLSFGGGITVQDALGIGGTYATTINGMTVHYQLTGDNARAVLDLTLRAYAAVDQLVREAADDTNKVESPVESNSSQIAPQD